MTIKEIVNPDNRDLTVLYGGSGADISYCLLTTNASVSYFVDKTPVHAERLEEEIGKWESVILDNEYVKGKKKKGYSDGSDVRNEKIYAGILKELKALGVKRQSIRVEGREFDGEIYTHLSLNGLIRELMNEEI